MKLDAIAVGDRVRKDMGDIESLAESMKRHGLLHPVVVKKDRTLVAGHRRIEAAKRLGWEDISVTMIEVEDLLSAERDENTERKDFTPTEAVAIGRLIEEQERPKALQRRLDGAARGGAKAGHVDSTEPVGAVSEIAARALGMGRPKYNQAKAIVAAAESNPEKFGDLPARMDETGNVHGTHKELERRRGGKNGQKPRHAALRKLAYPKPNREMQRAVDSLDGICICLKALPLKQLDPSKVKAWSVALKKSASIIARVARGVSNVKAS